ncbi:hypothetical protein PJF56_01390 [Roseofilum sp. BLCC_M91]|uniref:7-carboxy-7-deazaguanine synthase n=1 Tax=Roseofilum halophilum BLCC-M91 TaxID=3022259 RepID=A0ABT7BE94_9CYAN|nr:hypothetical protein [Roseofilum halophilum]MDJ1177508.1 hypothetical protein [Roseofilum halophilum BLCC-M91]
MVKFLQPEWNSLETIDLTVKFVWHHPEWRMSLQTHKFLGWP